MVTKENWRGIYNAVKLAADTGAENVRISAIHQSEGDSYFEDFYLEARDLARKAVDDFQRDDFRVFNMFGDRVQDLHVGNPEYKFCGYQTFNTYIGGDQNLYRCCNTAYNHHGFLGSLLNQKLSELWATLTPQMFEFDARSCERCMFNNKNETILYALEDDPEHVNFV